MKLPHLLFLALFGLALTAACGDGPDAGPARTSPAGTSGAPGSTVTPFGAAPTLGQNVVKIYPTHAATVKQAATRPASPTSRGILCADVSFEGLGNGNAQAFRMAYDGSEVTEKLQWFIQAALPATGTVCYQPAEGLAIGRHTAALSVSNPNDLTGAPKQVVAWAFDVTP